MAVKANVTYKDGSVDLCVWYLDQDCNDALKSLGLTENKPIERVVFTVIGEDDAKELCAYIEEMFGDGDEG